MSSEPAAATAADPRPAATVIVARDEPHAGLEFLVVRRSADSRFAPRFIVFPGGVVERTDSELAVAWFGEAEEIARACAVRELAEETGLVVTAGGLVEAPGRLPGDPGLPAPGREQLTEVARWVAPEFLPTRFDTTFFAVAAGPGLIPRSDGVETDRVWWAGAERILRAHRSGEAPLMWPTLKMLEALAECRGMADVLRLRVEQVPPPGPGGIPGSEPRAQATEGG